MWNQGNDVRGMVSRLAWRCSATFRWFEITFLDGSSLYQILREILSKIFHLPIGLLFLALKYFKLENHTISGQLITWEDVMEQEFVSALKRFQNVLNLRKNCFRFNVNFPPGLACELKPGSGLGSLAAYKGFLFICWLRRSRWCKEFQIQVNFCSKIKVCVKLGPYLKTNLYFLGNFRRRFKLGWPHCTSW